MHLFGSTSRMQGRDCFSPETSAGYDSGCMQSQETSRVSDGNTGRSHGRPRLMGSVVVGVSAVAVIAILSAVAVMRDNTKISAETAGRYNYVTKDDIRAETDGITAQVVKMQQDLETVSSTVSDNKERIMESVVSNGRLSEMLSGIDAMVSDVTTRMESIDHMISGTGFLQGGLSDRNEDGRNGSTNSIAAGNAGDSTNGVSVDISESILSAYDTVSESASNVSLETKELISIADEGNRGSFEALYEAVERLQEYADNLMADVDDYLSEVNGMVTALSETSSEEHQEILDAITEMQNGLASCVQSLSASVSGLIDKDTEALMSELDGISGSITDMETSVSSMLAAMQSGDVSRMEEVRDQFADVKGKLAETESGFTAMHGNVQQMVRAFKENRDKQHAEWILTGISMPVLQA